MNEVELKVRFVIPDGMEIPDMIVNLKAMMDALVEKFPYYYNSWMEMGPDDYSVRMNNELVEYQSASSGAERMRKARNIANLGIMAAEVERLEEKGNGGDNSESAGVEVRREG